MINPRHEGHHHHDHSKDKKWGYITFLVSIGYVAYLFVSSQMHYTKWLKTGRSSGGINWVKPGLVARMSVFVLTAAVICAFPGDLAARLRRFGRVAYCFIPLTIFLTYRPCLFPQLNYLELLSLHKWLSRLMVALAIVHSVGFWLKWLLDADSNTWDKIFTLNNFVGVVTFLLSSVLLIVSLKPLRRIAYQFFYLFHNVVMWLWVFAIVYHSRWEVVPFTIICGAMLAYQLYQRIFKVSRDITPLQLQFAGGLAMVKLPNLYGSEVLPGSHVRVYANQSVAKLWNFLLPSHPYSVIKSDSSTITLLVKGTSFFSPEEVAQYTMSTLLYSTVPTPLFSTAENIIIVCGGSGLSFGYPIFRYFIENKRGRLDVTPRLIWVTRSDSSLYVLEELQIRGIEIYVTGGIGESSESETLLQDVELDSLDDRDVGENVIAKGHRPHLQSEIRHQMAQTADRANRWIVSCGPESLIRDCDRVARAIGAQHLCEKYSM